MAGGNPDFFTAVYDVVRQIPRGRVTSYGAIARFLGAARSARMVGYAMHAAATMPDVPAHRVVNSAGLLTGKHHFAPPLTRMADLLAVEGVVVKEDKVVGFERVFWDPAILLEKL